VEVDMSFERSSNRGSGRVSAPAEEPRTLGPGKQTLTAQLDAKMGGRPAAPAADVHAAAAHGIGGGATALPFHAEIQRSFGRHDIGQVRAHVGGAAAEGAEAMGAHAYAAGDHVAFAGAPDLRTAAHEAAHVVQQRGGVQLAGGVGESGDAYEQHADAVAELVVQGKSSEALLDRYAGGPAESSAGAPAGVAAGGGAVQRYAFINGKQVKKTDPIVSGAVVDFVTDTEVRDYHTAEELKNHVAGQTDYLGNLRDDHNTWVRFSPTGLNVLGEMHDTESSLKHVMKAVGSKSFISEALSSDDLPAGSHLKAAYEARTAGRMKEMGIDQVKDKKQFGAEPLLPKIGFAMTALLPYLNTRKKPPPDKNVHALTKDNYEGKIFQSQLKYAWAYGMDTKTSVAAKHAAMEAVPPKLEALAKAVTALESVLDPYLTGLPQQGWLGDTLAQPANAALIMPVTAFAQAVIDALVELAIDDPSSRMDAKRKKEFSGATSNDQKMGMFSDWRNFKFEESVKDAAKRGVRYAGMGYHHMKHLQKVGLPANARAYDMMIEDLKVFEKHTDALKKIAVKQ
jgi:Domain of unknown function (DUF4157)